MNRYDDFLLLQDDEYAIYSCNQQRMKYLVEFTLPEDEKRGLDVSQASDTGIDIDDDSEGHDSGIIGEYFYH